MMNSIESNRNAAAAQREVAYLNAAGLSQPQDHRALLVRNHFGTLSRLSFTQRRALLAVTDEVPAASLEVTEAATNKQYFLNKIPMALLAQMSNKARDALEWGPRTVQVSVDGTEQNRKMLQAIIAWATKQCSVPKAEAMAFPDSFEDKMRIFAIAVDLGIRELVDAYTKDFWRMPCMSKDSKPSRAPTKAEIDAIVTMMPLDHWTVQITASKCAWLIRTRAFPNMQAMDSYVQKYEGFYRLIKGEDMRVRHRREVNAERNDPFLAAQKQRMERVQKGEYENTWAQKAKKPQPSATPAATKAAAQVAEKEPMIAESPKVTPEVEEFPALPASTQTAGFDWAEEVEKEA